MRTFAGLIALLLSALPLAPARAESPAALACPVANMNAGEYAELGNMVADLAASTDARHTRFRAIVGQCARGHDWSDAQSRLVLVHNLSEAGQRVLVARLAERGVSVAEVEPVILGDAAFMAAAAEGTMDDAAIGAFIARHEALLESVAGAGASADTGELLGRFIMFRAVAEVTRRQFVAS